MLSLDKALKQKDTELTTLIKAIEKQTGLDKATLLTKDSKKLRLSNQRGIYRCYQVDSSDSLHKTRYLKKEEADLAKELAQHNYLKDLAKAVDHQQRQIRRLLGHFNDQQLPDVYEKLSPGRKALITPLVVSDETFASDWQKASFEPLHYPADDEASGLYSERGEPVRSKTEKILADYYYHHDIPYRYECPLELTDGWNVTTIYPDFTLLNRKTRHVYYHEHFGMMDDLSYVDRTMKKLELYEMNGLFPGDGLLITFESSAHPLNMKRFESLVQHYLLSP